ncbi:MAG TPA: ABC-F family ATP-binding cassette domain-containing protein [Saprospiraceae bacterium]|nr:ABC-F family ATP-binding cassette domain-containing protein [Saprospiraceae bacterium]
MNYLRLERVTKTYGEKILFRDLDLMVNQGDKIAIVARNGSGKSSLLRIIAGQDALEGEKASMWINKNIKTIYLQQEPEFSPGLNCLQAILEGQEEWLKPLQALHQAHKHSDHTETQAALQLMDEAKAWETEAYIQELISKFKLPDYQFAVDSLSGGQKKRLAIVKALCNKPEFLILDEPTNHLDLEMIEWLEQYLENSNITLLMVTHDRFFLNRVCNQILELDKGVLYKYQGDYEDYLEKKALRMQNEATVKDKSEKLLRKELEWVRRMPKARTTKSKSRVDQFYDLKESLQGPKELGEIEFEIEHTRLGTKILELHHVCFNFADKKIVDGFSYKFKQGDKVGIVGPNGAGKSSLLNLFTGSLKTNQGKIIIGDTVKFGYYRQDGMKLEDDLRVIDVIRNIADYIPLKKGHKLSAESLLERFLFPRPQQQVYVSQLSGGEKRRLYLLTILISNPNFLILDEPTNDLDVITLNVLEEFLMDFPGVLVIVSHDRYFMDKLVQHLFVIEKNGIIRDFPGNYSDFRSSSSYLQSNNEDTDKRAQQSEKGKENKISFQEKKEMNALERQNEKLAAERSQIHDEFCTLTLSQEEMIKKNNRLLEIQEQMERNELRWMELADKM